MARFTSAVHVVGVTIFHICLTFDIKSARGSLGYLMVVGSSWLTPSFIIGEVIQKLFFHNN